MYTSLASMLISCCREVGSRDQDDLSFIAFKGIFLQIFSYGKHVLRSKKRQNCFFLHAGFDSAAPSHLISLHSDKMTVIMGQ